MSLERRGPVGGVDTSEKFIGRTTLANDCAAGHSTWPFRYP